MLGPREDRWDVGVEVDRGRGSTVGILLMLEWTDRLLTTRNECVCLQACRSSQPEASPSRQYFKTPPLWHFTFTLRLQHYYIYHALAPMRPTT